MKKKVLFCLTALALILTLGFSAGAVCTRAFVADAILPMDEEIFTSSAYETNVPEIPEDATVILYNSADVPEAGTARDAAEQPKASLVKPILVCTVIGLVIALIVVLSVKSSYKPVRRKRDAAQYLVEGSLRVTASDETFVRSERSERTIENKNPSGSNT